MKTNRRVIVWSLGIITLLAIGILIFIPYLNSTIDGGPGLREVSDTRQLGVMVYAAANDRNGIMPEKLEDLVTLGYVDDPRVEDWFEHYFYFPTERPWSENPKDRILLLRHMPSGVVVYRFGNSVEFIRIEH